MKKKINYVLTGSTGLLGRNLLFEIIKQNIDKLPWINIFILGRSSNRCSLKNRIQDILDNDGINYIATDKAQYNKLKHTFDSIIHCIELDLTNEKRAVSQSDEDLLKKHSIDYFFHIAAHTDFRSSEIVKKELWAINVTGTQHVLNLVEKLKVKNFLYTGSAYVCGETSGKISADYINLNQKFRNPYEKSKLEAEVLVRNFSKEHTEINFKYFRPSTISGRLIEKEIGAINKFDVFYSWMFLFLRCKEKMFNIKNLNEQASMNCRVAYSLDSGLNIVPVDYAAKVMYVLSSKETKEDSFHIVNSNETENNLYLRLMAKAINMQGLDRIDKQPSENLNKLEKFYYKTVGAIFTPYFISKSMHFIQPKVEGLIECPNVGKENFEILLKYALENRN